MKTTQFKEKVQARKAEGLKGVKVTKGDDFKMEKKATLNKKDAAFVEKASGH